MALGTDGQELLEHITTTITERFQPRRLILFGSRAKGEADAESDFDLFVELEYGDSRWSKLRPPERASLISSVFGLRPWSLDLLVYTPQEAARLRRTSGSLLSHIEAEGQVLYEQ
jgi:predicted nucleotidyltransferase